jgi:hypothetical protein
MSFKILKTPSQSSSRAIYFINIDFCQQSPIGRMMSRVVLKAILEFLKRKKGIVDEDQHLWRLQCTLLMSYPSYAKLFHQMVGVSLSISNLAPRMYTLSFISGPLTGI